MSLVGGPFEIKTDLGGLTVRDLLDHMNTLDVTLLDASSTATATLGGAEMTFTPAAKVTHHAELFGADRAEHVQQQFGVSLAPDQAAVLVRFSGEASVSAGARVPTGSIKLGLAASAGGSVTYEHLKTYGLLDAATHVLGDSLTSLRLPHQATTPETMPADGEVLITRGDGYLSLSADVTWGASFAHMTGTTLGDLSLAFRTNLTLAATAAARYRVAGAFDISCRRAGRRVRFVVRKSSDRTQSFAADFKLDAAFGTEGLPDNVNDFLGKLLGADADRVLRAIDRLQQFDSLEKIEAAVGDWAAGSVSGLAMPLIGQALDSTNVKAFLAALHEAAAQYTSLDDRVASLYQDFVDRVPELRQALVTLDGLTGPDALPQVGDSRAWTIFRRLAGDRLYDALVDSEAFTQVRDVVHRALDFVDHGPQRLKDVIGALQRELPIDPLIRKLEDVSSADALKALADARLRKAVTLLTGRAFADIEHASGPALEHLFSELRAALAALGTFNDRWYRKVLATANSKFRMTASAEFSRADTSRALVDVEIDVSTPEGQRLARRAALGDYEEVLADARSGLVTLRDGVLTHDVTRQATLQISVLGFTAQRVSQLLLSTEDRFQQTDAGLLVVHAFAATAEQRREVRDERILTRFMLRGVAEGMAASGDQLRDLLVDTVRSLSASYDYEIEDSNTSTQELLEYLGFAEELGLVSDRSAFLAALQREIPAGWTRVEVSYSVRYDPAAVAAVFLRETAEIQDTARVALLRLVSRALIRPGAISESHMGLAYRSPAIRKAFLDAFPNLPSRNVAGGVLVPGWVNRAGDRRELLTDEERIHIQQLLSIEKNYLAKLGELDRMMDRLRPNPQQVRQRATADDLDDLATDFVGFADDFPSTKRINPFFGTFDALVFAAAPRGRTAAMLLEITPKGGAETITKMVTA